MSIANLTNDQVLAVISKKIDLSRVPLTKSELSDEIDDCRKAGFSVADTAQVLVELMEDDNSDRPAFGGIFDL